MQEPKHLLLKRGEATASASRARVRGWTWKPRRSRNSCYEAASALDSALSLSEVALTVTGQTAQSTFQTGPASIKPSTLMSAAFSDADA